MFRAQKCIANHSCNGLNTLPDSDTGTDSDANSCPMQKCGVGNVSESVQCEKFCIVQCRLNIESVSESVPIHVNKPLGYWL